MSKPVLYQMRLKGNGAAVDVLREYPDYPDRVCALIPTVQPARANTWAEQMAQGCSRETRMVPMIVKLDALEEVV